jgi:predicted DNA-binding protein
MPSGKNGVTRTRFPSTISQVLALRLKGLSAQTGINQSKLIDEAIEDLLNKYGDDPKQYIIKKRKEEF